MLISLNWLKDYVDIEASADGTSVDELCHQLTMAGLEIEAITRPGEGITNVVIGKILSIDPHPDADKLVVCKTDVGRDEPLQIVCGAKNMGVGDLVPTALVGATLPGGFEIGSRKMRGVQSSGMMCSASELGLGDDHSGLMILHGDFPIGEDALPLLGLDDTIIEVEITPNRGDWASMLGVARELAAINESEYRKCDVSITESSSAASSLSSVTIEDPDLCPRYIGRVLTDVKIGPSPEWMQQRLVASGQRPINNIVDITNCVLMETGHPLHAFDLKKLGENRIVVRRAKQNETLKTIDEQSRTLNRDMLIIADSARPVAIAGVMGGFDSEVGESTTQVFLESAYFDPISVRRTARALGMQTEASARFQRGADPDMAAYAIDRAAALMQELAGATVAAGTLDEYPREIPAKQITLRYARAGLLLGACIPADFQQAALQVLGFQLLESDDSSATFEVPSWRHDCSHEADLIEEVARIYGYEKIELTIPSVRPSQDTFAPEEDTIRNLRNHLASQGLSELMSMTFTRPEAVDQCQLADAHPDMVALQNPLSENVSIMRPALMPSHMAIVANNIRHGRTSIAAFEIGPVYAPNPKADLPSQATHLGLVLTGQAAGMHWSSESRSVDFFDLKGWTQAVLDHIEAPCELSANDLPHLAPGQSVQVIRNTKPIGSMGLVNPKALRAYDIEQPVYLLELTLDSLLDSTTAPTSFQELPGYPPSLRDMAVIVSADIPVGELCAVAEKAGGRLLKKADIFDIYTGDQVPVGKKSVALSLTFQSDERTLTDKDTQKAWDKILKRLSHDFEAELR